MPYADPEEQKAYRRRWYREKLANDKEFREEESSRKADWFRGNEGRKKKQREYQREIRGTESVEVKLNKEETAKLRDEARRRGVQLRTVLRELALEKLEDQNGMSSSGSDDAPAGT